MNPHPFTTSMGSSVSSGPCRMRGREVNFLTEGLPRRNAAVRTVGDMEQTENHLQRLLQLVESAQRAGHSENEIAKIVDDAIDVDAELDAAA